ncbi:gametocyte-specific factor 1 homolog [Topomyia yanbarensis]|uniref:gametocyte-specific factor 1 homolog n=1 Tax=Topomyia yanbarensis TaxID=2498891 RepID=UPI00273CEE7F|nr:gametocyte-specific factor 1 homolog [Topomyia yanbarensis]
MDRQLLSADHSDLNLLGYEDIVECPYNRAHQIMSFRMQTHLYKCRKNHKDLKYVKCPFNETHDMPAQELKYHTSVCPDREAFDRYKYCISTSAATFAPEVAERSKPATEHSYNPNYDMGEESWDGDCKVRAYNPGAYARRSNVIRRCTGMAPSEKKAFKEAERQRLQEMGRIVIPQQTE